MKKRLFTVLMAVFCVLFSLSLTAQDEGGEGGEKKKEKKQPAPLEDVSATGVVEKKEGKKGATYVLKTASGVVGLPAKKGKEAMDYSSYEGKTVTVKGKGGVKVKAGKDGEVKTTWIKVLESIEEGGAEGGEGRAPAEEKAEEGGGDEG